jgi:hypothetical protein
VTERCPFEKERGDRGMAVILSPNIETWWRQKSSPDHVPSLVNFLSSQTSGICVQSIITGVLDREDTAAARVHHGRNQHWRDWRYDDRPAASERGVDTNRDIVAKGGGRTRQLPRITSLRLDHVLRPQHPFPQPSRPINPPTGAIMV